MGKFFAAILRPFINFGLEARLEKFWRNSAKGKKVASKHYDQDTEMLKEMQTKHPEVIQILERKDENLDMNLKKLALKESVEKSPMADLRHSGVFSSTALKTAAGASTTPHVKIPPGKISFTSAVELLTLSQTSISDSLAKAEELGVDARKIKSMLKYVAPFAAVRDIEPPPPPPIIESKLTGRHSMSFEEYLQMHSDLRDRMDAMYNKSK